MPYLLITGPATEPAPPTELLMMPLNRPAVEHAIAQTLKQRRVDGDMRAVNTQLHELYRVDPRHWNENLRAYAQITSRIGGFPSIVMVEDPGSRLPARYRLIPSLVVQSANDPVGNLT